MNVAFIPVRGGSRSIPLKNIKKINGKPLVYWVTKAACESSFIDKVYVSTDSEIIRAVVEEFKNRDSGFLFDKLEIIGRSEKTATDTASTESALLEFAEKFTFDNVVLIQATSPLLLAADLDRGFHELADINTDSVLSVVKQKRFIWQKDDSGFSYPVNYDYLNRPRRQEFEGYYVENGAFYITSRDKLMESRCRISGRIKTVEMSEDTFYEIDEPDDWYIIESFMKKRSDKNIGKIPDIKMFLSDCDGCLTDGGMYYSENGDELKKFNTKDGMGFKLLKKHGVITGIITGESVDLNRRRVDKLKLDIYEAGCNNKLDRIKELCKQRNIDIENVCYVGDDINDLDVIRAVGFGCAPSDAVNQVKQSAKYVTISKGGEGVIREIVDMIASKTENNKIEK